MKYYIFDESSVGVSYNDEIPDGAIECGVDVYNDSRGYKVEDGQLIAPTDEEIARFQKEDDIQNAELKKQELISAALNSVSVIQLKLQSGRTLTQAEQDKLNKVLDYIDELEAVDVADAPDIEWPSPPVWSS